MHTDNAEGLTEPLARVEHEPGDGVVFAVLSGEIDLSNAMVVEEEVLAGAGDGALAIDLTNLLYLDSSGLAMCIVVPVGVPTRRLFELVGLDDALPVVADREAALGRIAAAADSDRV